LGRSFTKGCEKMVRSIRQRMAAWGGGVKTKGEWTTFRLKDGDEQTLLEIVHTAWDQLLRNRAAISRRRKGRSHGEKKGK